MRAKKSLGQHFLKSESALSKIIDAADPTADDIILEIGPGTGVLTKRLVFFAGKVIAVEKDRELLEVLKQTFAHEITEGRLDLIEGDILKFDPSVLRLYDHPYAVVANIPYYITGAIIEQFLSTSYQPERMVLLIQKEVADRIVAKDKKGSVLSVAVQAYGTPRIVAKVPAGAFNPPPKVDSAILVIENISRDFFTDCDEEAFFKVVKFVFGKKRGQLGGRLREFRRDLPTDQLLAELGIDPKLRPENLSPGDWKRLTQKLLYSK